jgi:hypothetical protein
VKTGDNDFLTQKLVTKRQTVTLGTDFDCTVGGTIPSARRFYVGTGGTVVLKDESGASFTYKNVLSGSYIDGEISTVLSTTNGTTATDIIAER